MVTDRAFACQNAAYRMNARYSRAHACHVARVTHSFVACTRDTLQRASSRRVPRDDEDESFPYRNST
jgi:hypothetical protein